MEILFNTVTTIKIFDVSSLIITNSFFAFNKGYLGGVIMAESTFLLIYNCDFLYNQAKVGGVLNIGDDSVLRVHSNYFLMNKANYWEYFSSKMNETLEISSGGCFFFKKLSVLSSESASIEANIFSNNQAKFGEPILLSDSKRKFE